MATISGGDALEAKLKEIAQRLGKSSELEVGFLEGATYPDDAHTPVGQVAAWLNYGTKTAPPRPFFSNMVKAEAPKWGDKLARVLLSVNYDISKAFAIMGEGIGGQLYQALVDLDSPALSPVTLMLRQMQIDDPNLVITGKVVGEAYDKVKKGDSYAGASTKVGVYTGHLLRSVAYSVDDGEHVGVTPS